MRPIHDDDPIRSDPCEGSLPLTARVSASVFAESSKPAMRKGMFSIFDQAVVSGANFLTLVIIARSCSQAEVGIYSLAWTIIIFMAAAQANLISIPYTMYCHQREGSSLAEYGGSAIIHQLVLSVTATVCFIGLAILLSLGVGPSGLRSSVWVLSGVIPFILLRDFARRFLFAHLAQETATVMDVAVTTLQVASLLALWWLGLLSPAAVYGVMGAACAAAAAGWWFLRKQPVSFSRQAIVRDWRQNWSFGRWALTGQMTGLAFYALPWLLAIVHGEAETGKLAVCTTLVGLSNLFVMGLNNFLMPKAAQAFARDGARALGDVLRKASIASASVLGILCVGVFLVGDLVARIVFGPMYADTGTLLTVLALAALANSLGQTAAAGLWTLDRPAANFAADLVQVSVTLGTAIWLVFSLGALGVAIAIVAGRVVGAIVRWIILWGFMEHCRQRSVVDSCQATQQ